MNRGSAHGTRKAYFQSVVVFGVRRFCAEQVERFALRIRVSVTPADAADRGRIIEADRTLHFVVDVMRLNRMARHKAVYAGEKQTAFLARFAACFTATIFLGRRERDLHSRTLLDFA